MEANLKKLTINEQIFLIAIFNLGDEAYGVKIRKKIKELTGTSMLFGTIYNTLEYLTRKEYIAVQKGSSRQGNEKKRVYYSITEDGLKALKQARDLQNVLWQSVPENILRQVKNDG